ncbi:phage tail tape measure protein [Pseudalkalibacillus sp. R45]|uniref:phage tail tape measure protein n=1 Tax=Pseudalkalibacillus sp. R45 TaxID=3457433 RepID=UPI003FCCE050
MTDVGKIRATLELNAKSFEDSMRKARDSMDKTGKNAQKTKKNMTDLQKGFVGAGAAIAGAIALSVRSAVQFEQKMADIASISNLSSDQLSQLSDTIKELAESSTFAIGDVSLAAEELIKAGLSFEDVIGGGLAGSLDLAAAGSLSMADAAMVASTALNSFKKDGLEMSDVADILAGGANASATSVMELQQGLSQVSAVASSAGMNFRDTVTSLSLFANAGLRGSDAGTSLKTMLQNLTPSTSAASKLMKELGIITEEGSNQFYDAQGNLKGLAEITDVLRDSLDELNPQERGAALKEMFGTDAVRAASILYSEAADGVTKMTDAMSKVSAADTAAKKMNTLRGSFEEFSGAMSTISVQVGEEFLPIFKKIVDQGTSIVRAFGDIDSGLVATGLKMGAAAAGVGVLLTSLVKLRIGLTALYASLGPGGWMIAGISLLSGLFVGLYSETERMTEVNLDNANALAKQREELEKNTAEFDQLAIKSQLSNAQFARFLDIQTELANTTAPDKIKALREEQAKLYEKSGLSNGELDRMAQLNNDLTTAVGTATDKITDQGNRVIETTDKIKEYNEKLKDATLRELESERFKAIAKERDIRADINDMQSKLEEGLKREQELRAELNNYDAAAVEKQAEKIRKQLEGTELSGIRRMTLEHELKTLEDQWFQLNENLGKEIDQNEEQREKIKKKQQELGLNDEILKRMTDIYLEDVNINNAKGDGVQKLDQQLNKLYQQRDALINNTSAQDKQNSAYRIALDELDFQISKHEQVKDKINFATNAQGRTNSAISEGSERAAEMNRRLGEDVGKDVRFKGDGLATAQSIHEWLTKPAHKSVSISESATYSDEEIEQVTALMNDIWEEFKCH